MVNQTESALEAEIRALDAYQQKHTTCDIQRHPWHAVFGAGFAAGMAWERQTELENGLRAARRRAEDAEAEATRLRAALEAQQVVEDHELECVFCLHQEDCNERARLAADAGVARSDILGE